MFSGSSAITQGLPRQQITSPALRVRLTENSFLTSQNSPFNSSLLLDGVIFNNVLVVTGQRFTGLITQAPAILTYSMDGSTLLAGVSLTSISGQYAASFFDAGQTLHLFYLDKSGNTSRVMHVTSTDGIAWGATEIIYAGSSNQLSDITNIAAASPTRVYITNKVGATLSYNQISLKIITNMGSWGNTTIYSPYIGQMLYSNTFRGTLSAIDSGNVDTLFITRSLTTYGLSGGGMELLSLKTDKIANVFGERTIITAQAIDTLQIAASKVSKGLSNYYIGIRSSRKSQPTFNSLGIQTDMEYGVMRSADLDHWSVPVPLTLNTLDIPIIVAGKTVNNPEYMVLGTSYTETATNTGSTGLWVQVSKSINILDISANIIDYRNTNNTRVDLSLGNMK